MSKANPTPTDDGVEPAESSDDETEPDDPDIESDLVEETIRIDGICGVY